MKFNFDKIIEIFQDDIDYNRSLIERHNKEIEEMQNRISQLQDCVSQAESFFSMIDGSKKYSETGSIPINFFYDTYNALKTRIDNKQCASDKKDDNILEIDTNNIIYYCPIVNPVSVKETEKH